MTIVSATTATRKVKDTVDPFARPHAHGTTLALEPAQLCGNRVVAFRQVVESEVPGRAGFGSAVRDTPNRDANAWQRGARLVVDRSSKVARRLRASGSSASTTAPETTAITAFILRTEALSCHFADAEGLYPVPVCGGADGLAGARWDRRSRRSPQAQQVLVLQSFHRGSLPVDYFTGNFRVDLDQRAERPVNVVQVVVGPTGFIGAPDQASRRLHPSTFADRPKPDLIVTVAGPAAVFARTHRQELFPDIAAPVRVRRSTISSQHAARRERDRRCGRQRFSRTRR